MILNEIAGKVKLKEKLNPEFKLKKINFLLAGTILLFLFNVPAFPQLQWNVSRIDGTGGSSKSFLPAYLPEQSTPSEYPNITMYPDANVDQSEMSISTAPANTFNVLAGDNAVPRNILPPHYNQGYYYSTNEGGSYAGSDL
jgi:hypothetical protein